MESRSELIKARYSVAEAAELIGKHPSHLRRLWKRGLLPAPRKTAGGRPYYDDELLAVIRTVMQSGIGLNGEEVLFYRQRAKARRHNRSSRSGERKPPVARDPYILSLKDALTQLGIPKDRLEPDAIQAQLAALYGDQRPEIKKVLHQLAKRMME